MCRGNAHLSNLAPSHAGACSIAATLTVMYEILGACGNAALCFKCKRPGHMARDCPTGAQEQETVVCLRCGHHECASAGKADYVRWVPHRPPAAFGQGPNGSVLVGRFVLKLPACRRKPRRWHWFVSVSSCSSVLCWVRPAYKCATFLRTSCKLQAFTAARCILSPFSIV